MSGLESESCIACKGTEPVLTAAEIEKLRLLVPLWRVSTVAGVKHLARDFVFPDFRTAMAFAVRIGEVAEREGHHPDLHVGWGKVGVETWTHAIRGLHRNDFVLAAKIDALPAA